ncbi:hypothetical protein PQR75_06040 [Paraburkholderia fungorum]|jgi:hypothetical protein|uniref:hypothetical protein n=1 Tax=Paraburkholderia fungorum TaxID=134537 RepID=UPI0038BA33AF
MKHLIASSLVVALAAVSAHAIAQTSSSNATPKQSCAIAYVTGIGGSAQSVREYMASSSKYRYLADNPIQCKVSDEGRTSDCVGLTNFRNERVSVYDDTDDRTIAVVARVELDQGTYPAIVVVPKEDVKCEE